MCVCVWTVCVVCGGEAKALPVAVNLLSSSSSSSFFLRLCVQTQTPLLTVCLLTQRTAEGVKEREREEAQRESRDIEKRRCSDTLL